MSVLQSHITEAFNTALKWGSPAPSSDALSDSCSVWPLCGCDLGFGGEGDLVLTSLLSCLLKFQVCLSLVLPFPFASFSWKLFELLRALSFLWAYFHFKSGEKRDNQNYFLKQVFPFTEHFHSTQDSWMVLKMYYVLVANVSLDIKFLSNSGGLGSRLRLWLHWLEHRHRVGSYSGRRDLLQASLLGL